jgi:light-regulated signal transduction histidine kinase (bacteriophytochrome)
MSGVVLVFRDVTERRSGEKYRQAQALQLRRTNEELNQFAYAVTHDLREPLRNVVNFSQFLLRAVKDGSEADAQTSLGYIVEGVQRMEMLLNDLLAYSQAAGSQEAASPVDMNDALKTALENLKSSISESGAVVTSEDLPPALGNGGQIVQVFQNLISNAIKYRSQAQPSVEIRAQKNEHEWIFKVRDNGIGIPAQYQGSIFGLFRRLHGREIPGTGMGLAICSKIIERHGGRLGVTSQPGGGSEFFFSLPVASS